MHWIGAEQQARFQGIKGIYVVVVSPLDIDEVHGAEVAAERQHEVRVQPVGEPDAAVAKSVQWTRKKQI